MVKYYQFILLVFLSFASCSERITRSNAANTAPYLQPEYILSPSVPLHVNNYYPPTLATLESGYWLVYELHLHNYYTSSIRIDGVEVLSDSVAKKYLYRSTGSSFSRNFKNLTYPADSLKTTLGPGEGGIIFFWIPLQPDADLPSVLYQRLLIELLGKKMSLTTSKLNIEKTSPVILAPPVKGLWMVAQGVDPDVKSTEGHNRLLYPRFGKIRMPQRFASDWIKLDADNKVFRGDSSKNENYHGFGADVYAVADGIITETQNDVPENIPPEMTVPRTAKNITGNYIVLKMKDGRSVYYGHLQAGSVRVNPGDQVSSGQALAKVGNTGNSTGAHLHFQVQDGNHFFDEGYPFTFQQVVKYARATKLEIDDMADKGRSFEGKFNPVRLTNVLPTFGDIILFE